jgi:hypothetical protein
MMRKKKRFHRTRAGSMLIETLMGFAAGSMVMLTAIGLIHQSMHWSKRVHARSEHTSQIDRLAAIWRADAHAASGFTVDDSVGQFLQRDGARIQYRIDGNSVVRTEYEASVAATENASSPVQNQESFRLNDRTEITFQSLTEPSRAMITLQPKTPTFENGTGSVAVASVIGRWDKKSGGNP